MFLCVLRAKGLSSVLPPRIRFFTLSSSLTLASCLQVRAAEEQRSLGLATVFARAETVADEIAMNKNSVFRRDAFDLFDIPNISSTKFS